MQNKKAVMPSLAELASWSARMKEICAKTQIPDYSVLQTVLNSSALWANAVKPKYDVMDVAIGGGTLAALAAMEAQTKTIAQNMGLSQITSITSQLSAISESLSSQTRLIKELIAPSTMLADLQRIAEQTHKSIIDAGALTYWQLGVLDSASFMVDRQIDWSSHYFTTALEDESSVEIEELDVFTPQINIIESLPEELEAEKSKNEGITVEDALEKTTSFKMSESGKRLAERIVNINKLCKRKKLDPIFKYTDATFLASSTLSGTICSNSGSFGNVIDSLYFIFYENIKHIKKLVTDQAVRDEDVYQCIFRVKDMRTDLRHDYEHGDNIDKKTRDIADSYSHYSGKMLLTSSDDYKKAQEGLYNDFYTLTGRLLETVEKC